MSAFKLILPYLASTFVLFSETIVLTSGEKIEAVDIVKGAQGYEVTRLIGKGIRDHMVIPFEDVVKVIKGGGEDAADFEKLDALFPVDNGKDLKYYNDLLDKYFYAFEDKHPKSPLLEKAKKIRKQVEEERDLIESGSIKFEGEFISAGELEGTLMDFRAKQYVDEVRAHLKNGKRLSAFRAYTPLRDGYMHTNAFKSLSKEIAKAFLVYQSLLEEKIAKPDAKPTEKFLAGLGFNEARRIESGYVLKRKKLEALMVEEKERGEAWITVDTENPASMHKALKFTELHLKELDDWSQSPFVDGGQLYSLAYLAIQQGNVDGASVAIEAYKKIKPPQELLDKLTDAFSSLEEEIEEKENPAGE